MEKKNKNPLKHLAILLFCPPCLSMTLLAIAIGAPLDVILWMASGPLLIMGVAAFVVILDRHAIWGLTREQPKTNVWRRATNVWRRLTSPARGAKRLSREFRRFSPGPVAVMVDSTLLPLRML
jgi:hypothetical protein